MWINASTFLPVRSVTGEGPYAPRIDSTFTWLPATEENRAVFTPELPAGFRDVSGSLHRLTTRLPAPSPSPTASS